MYTREYVASLMRKDLDRKRVFQLSNVCGLVVFLASVFLIAPIVHENAHNIVLLLLHCPSVMDIRIEYLSVEAAGVVPFCDMSPFETVLFYSAGVGAEFLISLMFFLISWRLLRAGRIPASDAVVCLGLGFSANVIFYFFQWDGDLVNILDVFGWLDYAGKLSYIGFFVFVFMVGYFYFHVTHSMRTYHLINERIKALGDSIDEIKNTEEWCY